MLISCNAEEDNSVIKDPVETIENNESAEYIAIFGDIQYYTNATYNSLYEYSCDWILAQKHAGMNINSVLHTGDITQGNGVKSWGFFLSATEKMAQEIPYISAIGDHDYTWEDKIHITDRNATEFSKYAGFSLTKQKVIAWYEEGRMENIVVENYIHGVPIYFLVLEFGPRKEVVAWANEYVKSHPNINFILLNHEYLEMGGGRRTTGLKCVARLRNTTYTTPEELWEQLIKCNNNIICVLCGHVGGLYAYTPEMNDYGREVPQIQHNIQGSKYRYDNWLMLWEFPSESNFANVKIINTKTLEYYGEEPVLFQFRYKF